MKRVHLIIASLFLLAASTAATAQYGGGGGGTGGGGGGGNAQAFSVTIRFDGQEAGVSSGTTSFSFMGSNWSGGFVGTQGILALYASGRNSYHVEDGTVQVTFDHPIDSVNFFFVHGFGTPAGTATAFDSAGNAIGSANSRAATFFGDAENFVTLNPQQSIARIEFSSGVVDNFTYTEDLVTMPPPPPEPEPDPDPEPEPNAGSLEFSFKNYLAAEGGTYALIAVKRSGGADGKVTAEIFSDGGSASAGGDFEGPVTVTFRRGEQGEKIVKLPIVDDDQLEGPETVELFLSNPSGASLGSRDATTLTIVDNEGDASACVENDTTVCLNNDRFRVELVFRQFQGEIGAGRIAGFQTDDSGLLYFFDSANLEFLVKVLDGCVLSNSFWVFAAATTNVEYILTVTDTLTGDVAQFTNPLGMSAPAITDTSAFPNSCGA